jgi:hypothetical protein
VPQADVLEGGELIDGREQEDPTGEIRTGVVPREGIAGRGPTKLVDPVAQQARKGPGEQISADEESGGPDRDPLSPLPPPFLDPGVHHDHRRNRREHHRRHHHHPDADEESERSGVRAGSGVHPGHLIVRDRPRRRGQSDEQADQPELDQAR